MSAIWHDHGLPSFLGAAPRFSFHELAEVHEVAPASYMQALVEVKERDALLGAVWLQHNAEVAHANWQRKKPWWL